MKKSITIRVVLCLMLSLTCVSWATSVVTPPPGAPSWWNSEAGTYYAYGWWSADIIGSQPVISPQDNSSHWASNSLKVTDFKANIGIVDQTITIDLDNIPRQDLYKKLYVYITGTTTSIGATIDTVLDTDAGVFTGQQDWSILDSGVWTYMLVGEIHPQPDFVKITFTVPGMINVTDIWAGEICVPEPATMSLMALGGLAMLRRRMSRS